MKQYDKTIGEYDWRQRKEHGDEEGVGSWEKEEKDFTNRTGEKRNTLFSKTILYFFIPLLNPS